MTYQIDCPACTKSYISLALAIGYEISSLAKQLPDDITVKILSQLEELKAIEAYKNTISLLINLQKLLDLDKKVLTTLN